MGPMVIRLLLESLAIEKGEPPQPSLARKTAPIA
jgi:hypothetical protein